ncbi:TetR/AcrR family transcriptional regulator [Amycolatopsis jiangsuensis]|uniref:AcrR family transcriptional regulator n=1 Tax=Amycolatopsis jiangsuensis TaxID=1181879 RepID=A0A840IN46_9PSEU|nr:TetR/AcrR family transcriptional regulator [Amycolatopsis jiangsuensis]MBB4683776.1 AcrR family transcriptional regulator [Amycolatopsis jiangsuensis]
MARWEPHPQERLARAALTLFAERGYDATTVNDIAERAGLTKSTFFRHCNDKREVLFLGQDGMTAQVAEAVRATPAGAPPADVLAAVLEVFAGYFPPEYRSTAAARATVVAAHAELRERELLKAAKLESAIENAVREQGRGEVAARFLAAVGLLALDITYRRWISDPGQRSYRDHAAEVLDEFAAQAGKLA